MPRTVVYRAGGFTNCGIGYTKFSQEELAERRDRAMTENEAIEALKLEGGLEITGRPIRVAQFFNGIEVAIKALEEVQQYRALEKHLSDMFGGSLSLKMCVDELERILVEPDSPHPMNAKILTYQEAADWEAYRAIGTVEELIRGKRYMNIAKHHGTIGQVIDECVAYEAIGTPEECRAAVEKQTAKRTLHQGCYDKNGEWHEWNGINGKPYELCPNCRANLCCETPLDIKPKYCKSCGQKLDWRNEE